MDHFACYRQLAVAVIYRAWLDVYGADPRAPRSAMRFFKGSDSTLTFWCRVAGLDEYRIRSAFLDRERQRFDGRAQPPVRRAAA
jgi:hypothetical protein